ncbi:MAG TPA: helix-turn-helix domain-containing protein [Ilumatobacter sp.]|nr:helix-turn-helix domain-containing protein [Ilumatobacter sp.]
MSPDDNSPNPVIARGSDESHDLVPRSIGRVLDLLETVAAAGQCSLTSAAAAVGLTPTTALRHLRALEARGYVDRDDDGRFAVGPTLIRLVPRPDATTALQRLLAAAQPRLDDVAAVTGESCYLAISDGAYATYIAWAEGTRAVRHVGWLGRHVPIEGTAIGAALALPGDCVSKAGAVEADITAIACASIAVPGGPAVVSLLGPSHRLRGADRTTASAAVRQAVVAIEAGLA